MKLYSFKYNNYSNRLVKKLSTIAEYKAVDSSYKVINNISFNPNDGVNATQLVPFIPGDYIIITDNSDTILSRWFIIESKRERTGQYTLILRRDLIVDNYNNIINAPCFIEKATLNKNDPMIFNSENMGFNQIKKNEYLLQDETNSAWVVGYVPSNIETKEVTVTIPLDHWDIEVDSLSNWNYYKYTTQDFNGPSTESHYGIAILTNTREGRIGIISSFNNNGSVDTNAISTDNTWRNKYFGVSPNTGLKITEDSRLIKESINRYAQDVTNKAIAYASDLNDNIANEFGLNTPSATSEFLSLRNKVIKVGNDFYKINISTDTAIGNKSLLSTSDIYKILDAHKPTTVWLGSNYGTVSGNSNSATYFARASFNTYRIQLTPIYKTIKCNIDPSVIYELNDSPYKMFCVPFSDTLKVYKNGILKYTSSKDIALSLGAAIGESVGSANVYDVQLLPFCPLRDYIKPSMAIWSIDAEHITDIDNKNEDFKMIVKSTYTQDSYVAIDGELSNDFTLNIYNTQNGRLLKTYKGSYFGVFSQGFSFSSAEQELFAQSWTDYNNSGTTIELIVAKGATLTSENTGFQDVLYQFNGMTIQEARFDYGNAVGISDIKDENNQVLGEVFWCRTSTFTFNIDKFGDEYISDICKVTNPKIQNETEMWRLVSPNYNGQFEFSVAKNNGVNFFNVDCNYKPFSPYIHINPDFSLLYGKDFNDARGLICGGDFSLPQVSSAWANYETSNKNYQNIFNREVQNMEFNNNIARVQEGFNIASGALGAGAGAGVISGNPIIGGIAGVFSLGGGIADYYTNESLRNEALDYKKDMYGYQLGNIKAMPNSLTRTSAFTYNNKIFPILEYYSCTEEEVQALENKIKYNGMTVMRIGTIGEFIRPTEQSYIKGRLIRIDIHEDSNYINAISDEIYKGGFF